MNLVSFGLSRKQKGFSFSFFFSVLVFLVCIVMTATGCRKEDGASSPTLPAIATAALTDITTGKATAGGTIVNDGGATIIRSGIVWSKTNATPTLADSIIASTATSGSFTVTLTGLDLNRVYYIRAYATNSVGTDYGDLVILTTVGNDTATVRFMYNGEEVVYGVITSPITGRQWLDRNLGAKRVATAFDDYQAYGDLFQWGRNDDGHQLMTWTSSTAGTPVNGVTTTIATNDNPGHNLFIDGTSNYDYVNNYGNNDWRSDNNRNRWNTIPQGPCPAGWHVPTKAEWAAEINVSSGYWGGNSGGTAPSGGITKRSTAFDLLKLTVAGFRIGYGTGAGQLFSPGNSTPGNTGLYWCSTDEIDVFDGPKGQSWEFGGSWVQQWSPSKSEGKSVRCISNL